MSVITPELPDIYFVNCPFGVDGGKPASPEALAQQAEACGEAVLSVCDVTTQEILIVTAPVPEAGVLADAVIEALPEDVTIETITSPYLVDLAVRPESSTMEAMVGTGNRATLPRYAGKTVFFVAPEPVVECFTMDSYDWLFQDRKTVQPVTHYDREACEQTDEIQAVILTVAELQANFDTDRPIPVREPAAETHRPLEDSYDSLFERQPAA